MTRPHPSPGTPTVGRRASRKSVTRRELLLAGRRLFGEKGLYESRIEDLTRRAGIAKGTLYGYFASKEDLVEAVVSAAFNELLGHAHRRVQDAASHADALAALAEAHLEFLDQNPDLMRIFHQVRGVLKFGGPGSVRLRRLLAGYLQGLAHLLATRRPGVRRSGAANLETATHLFGAVSGIASTRASLDSGALRPLPSRTTTASLVAMVLALEADAPRTPAAATRARRPVGRPL